MFGWIICKLTKHKWEELDRSSRGYARGYTHYCERCEELITLTPIHTIEIGTRIPSPRPHVTPIYRAAQPYHKDDDVPDYVVSYIGEPPAEDALAGMIEEFQATMARSNFSDAVVESIALPSGADPIADSPYMPCHTPTAESPSFEPCVSPSFETGSSNSFDCGGSGFDSSCGGFE